MTTLMNRRRFLGSSLAAVAGWSALRGSPALADASIPDFSLTEISGPPRERGRSYGLRFQPQIREFYEREIDATFVGHPNSRDDLLRYGDACGKAVADYAPTIAAELEGIAEGAGLRFEQAVLLTLHEELYHRSTLPPVSHCTAVAVGPPDSAGPTLVGQTWDWMPRVAGVSTLLHWRRSEGPSVLGYAYPGLWVGAGLNSAGLALCWTSADLGPKELTARVGVPSYVLLTHFLYQESLEAVEEEARRVTNAGWFTFVMADGEGRLLNVEGSPVKKAIEPQTGRLVRIGFGSREMTAGRSEPQHERCGIMDALIEAEAGTLGLSDLQRFFADPACGISKDTSTLDMMVFNTTERAAYVSRGPSYRVNWQRFGFDA